MTDRTRREFLQSIGVGTVAVATAGRVGAVDGDSGSWPTFGNDAGNAGVSGSPGPATAPGPRWSVATDGSLWAQMAVHDGFVYVGSDDGTVYALATDDGELEERFETAGRVRSAPAVFEDDAGPNLVLVASEDGFLYAFDAETGEKEWEVDLTFPPTAPTVFDGTVYVGTVGGRVYAFDAATGEEEWDEERDVGAEISGAPAIWTGEEDVTGDGNDVTVFVGTEGGAILALDGTTGENLWLFNTNGPVRSAPVVAENTLYVGTPDIGEDAAAGYIHALDATARESEETTLLWEERTDGAVVASPAATAETVFVGTGQGILHAFDASDGTERWDGVDTGTGDVLAQPTVAGETVHVSNESVGVVAYDVETGEKRWTAESERAVRTAPVVAGEHIYVGSGTAVYGLDPDEDGVLRGALQAPGGDGTAVALGEDDDDGILGSYQFLLWPASAVAMVGSVLGVLYVAHRSGLLGYIEDAADAVGGVDDAGTGNRDAESGAPTDSNVNTAPGSDHSPSKPSAVWDLVLEDVISRAEETDRTAVENVILTKYVDSDTLESPVVAYEIESLRDDPARIRLSEPLLQDDIDDSSKPLGDNWAVDGSEVRFETVIQPDETVRTLVGRRDCSDDVVETLLEQPTIDVEES